MAIGQKYSYGTDTPVTGNPIGNALAQVEDVGFKYRQEKRLADEKKEKERKDNLVKDDFDPTVELTGNQSINDLSVPFAMQSAKRYSDNVNKINATTNLAERSRYMQENQRIKQNFDNYAQVPKILNTKTADILAGVKAGTLNPRDAERAGHMLDSLNSGKAKIVLDENSIPRLTTFKVTPTGELELDAQGKPIVLAENQDLASLIKSFEVHTNSNFDKSIIDFADKFKLDETGYEKSGNEYTKEQKDARTDRASIAFAKSQVSQPNERFELAQRLGIDEADIAGLETAVAQQFKDRIAEKDVQKHNYAFDTNARENRKEARELVQKTQFTNNTPLRNDVTGVVIDANATHPEYIGFDEDKVKFKNLGGEKGYGTGYVTSVALEKDGHILITGKALNTKGATFKVPDQSGGFKLITIDEAEKSTDPVVQAQLASYKTPDNYSDITKIYSVDTPELNSLAIRMGYKGADALKKDLRTRNKSSIDASKTKPEKKKVYAGVDSNGKIIYKDE